MEKPSYKECLVSYKRIWSGINGVLDDIDKAVCDFNERSSVSFKNEAEMASLETFRDSLISKLKIDSFHKDGLNENLLFIYLKFIEEFNKVKSMDEMKSKLSEFIEELEEAVE